MNCRQVEPMLSDYIEGLLPWRKADRIADHLRACSACRRLLDELLAAGAALRAPMEMPTMPGIERRIAQRWLADRGAIRSDRRHRFSSRFPTPIQASLLAATSLAIS